MLTEKENTWRDNRLEQIRQWEQHCKYPNFIDDNLIWTTINQQTNPDKQKAFDIVAKARDNSSSGTMLSPQDVAVLMNSDDPELWDAIFETANWIKRHVYGNRIVLFAPVYVSSPCVNNCAYCGFRQENAKVKKSTLNMDELKDEITALVDTGHKRTILVYGEHPLSDAQYICQTIETVYTVKSGYGEIRRANINAAPMFVPEYKDIRSAGIGTYQIFQETYHHDTYKKMHPKGTLKGEYAWRLFGLHRAIEAGIDDVAPGVLFGLYDWRFELLAMLYHAMALEKEFGIGPHTMSYPRMVSAVNTPLADHSRYLVSDNDFKKLVALIRLMCPYTGSILTAREKPAMRHEVVKIGGVSQMDAGTRIGVGGYGQIKQENMPDKQQFIINDPRSLDDFVLALCQQGYLPSFCTAGYREGRTGANFMPLAKQASVKNFCIANGILTFKEYLLDYASPKVKQIGNEVVIPTFAKWIQQNVPQLAGEVTNKLKMEEHQQRDQHF